MKKTLYLACILTIALSSCMQQSESANKISEETSISDSVITGVNEKPLPYNQFIAPKVPDSIVFAGETIYFYDWDLRERMDYELVANNFMHTSTIITLKRANRWQPIINKILEEENVSPDIFYVAVIESNLSNATSPAGAKGFWQFMPATGKEFGLKINDEVDERYHLEKATRAACKYLRNSQKKFGSWMLAAAGYNRGNGGISKELGEQSVDNFFDLSTNTETSRYVFRMLAVKLLYEHPEDYGFYLEPEDLYQPYETKDVVITSTIDSLSDWAIQQGVTLKVVKILNPWLIGKRLTVRAGEEYIIKLPSNPEQLGRIGG